MNEHADKSGSAFDSSSLFGLRLEDLRGLFESWGQPAYRASQVMEWVYRLSAPDYEDMTNLPKALRKRLADDVPLYRSRIIGKQESQDGTTKLLLKWPNGATSECVLIPEGPRRTACISSQVGCPVKCTFCASGMGGLKRQLSASEIVEQAMRVRQLCDDAEHLSNVVFMGLGEPLANYDATVRALCIINAEWGMAIGARKITVSTVGLPKHMRNLADEGMQITLALSLHAPTDGLRREIIPWAKRATIDSLIEACRYYFERTGREVTLEYVLLGEVNDGDQHARQLAEVAKQMRSNVNLISYNPVEGLPHRRTSRDVAQRFLNTLRSAGINAHLRPSRGLDIDAACGQLRRREGTTDEALDREGIPNE
ncbi:MAG: 23S rRNA (adenine(2503)-C(2))-methyltransferase RlmN [Phycisphaerales bacterium]|nr:MAG: 23S rRNA (adenine(2503)-C(2))-methyltransferase RlmN [Phycisphaerales bacterium]